MLLWFENRTFNLKYSWQFMFMDICNILFHPVRFSRIKIDSYINIPELNICFHIFHYWRSSKYLFRDLKYLAYQVASFEVSCIPGCMSLQRVVCHCNGFWDYSHPEMSPLGKLIFEKIPPMIFHLYGKFTPEELSSW